MVNSKYGELSIGYETSSYGVKFEKNIFSIFKDKNSITESLYSAVSYNNLFGIKKAIAKGAMLNDTTVHSYNIYDYSKQISPSFSPPVKEVIYSTPYSYYRYSPLHLACAKQCPESVELLLEAGANTEILDFKSRTPLHIACHFNNVKIVKLLLDYNASVHARDKERNSPINYVIKETENKEIFNILNLISLGSNLPVFVNYPNSSFKLLKILFGFDDLKNYEEKDKFNIYLYQAFYSANYDEFNRLCSLCDKSINLDCIVNDAFLGLVNPSHFQIDRLPSSFNNQIIDVPFMKTNEYISGPILSSTIERIKKMGKNIHYFLKDRFDIAQFVFNNSKYSKLAMGSFYENYRSSHIDQLNIDPLVYYLISEQDLYCLDILIKFIGIDYTLYNGKTLLIHAGDSNKRNVEEFLLKNGANVNKADANGRRYGEPEPPPSPVKEKEYSSDSSYGGDTNRDSYINYEGDQEADSWNGNDNDSEW